MRNLSVSEFCHRCDELKANTIIFSAENQRWYNPGDTMRFDMVFNNIVVFRNPSRVYLSSGKNYVSLDGVCRIVEVRKTVLGTIFNVFCRQGNSNEEDQYMLLMR